MGGLGSSGGGSPWTDDELRAVLGDPAVLGSPATVARVDGPGPDDRAVLVASAATLDRGEPVDLDDLRAVAERLAAAGDTEGAAWAWTTLSHGLMRAGRVGECLETVRAALDVAPEGFPPTGSLLVRLAAADELVGDLRSAQSRARAAFAAATAAGDQATALWALVYLSYFCRELGQLHRVEALVGSFLAIELSHAEPLGGQLAALRTVGPTLLGDVAAARGAWIEAAGHFDEAEDICREECPWFAWMVRCYRGVAMASIEPPMDESVLDELLAASPAAGREITWRFGFAVGAAMVHHGALDEGLARLTRARDETESVWFRAVIDLHRGEALAGVGRLDEAAEVLRAVVASFEAMGVSYWLARAWVALARAEPDRAELHLASALSLDDGDPCYGRLFEARQELRIDVGATPSIRIGDEPVQLAGRQAELTVYALAVAGERGVPVSELVDVLWPSPDRRRIPHRLRTLLWQVRRGLGPEAWRLHRDGDVVHLDLRGARVVGLESDELLREVRVEPGHDVPSTDGVGGSAAAGADDTHLLATWDHFGSAGRSWVRSLAARRRRGDAADGAAGHGDADAVDAVDGDAGRGDAVDGDAGRGHDGRGDGGVSAAARPAG